MISCRQLDEDLGLVDADIEVTVPLIPELEPQHCLWVEKYAPHRYTELLSDEVHIPQIFASIAINNSIIKCHLIKGINLTSIIVICWFHGTD